MQHLSAKTTKRQNVQTVQSVATGDSTGGAKPGVVGRRRSPGGGATVPPSSNTGALRADCDPTLLSYPDGFAQSPTLDYLSFTLHVVEPEKRRLPERNTENDRIIRLLEKGSFDPVAALLVLKGAVINWLGGGRILPAGRNGYKSSAAVLNTGRVCWSEDDPRMGVHVELPSSALQHWAASNSQSATDFLIEVLERGANVSRLDTALDTDQVPMSEVLAAHRDGLTVTRAKKWRVIEDQSGGQTLYIGSPSGRRMVRFYDKAAERAAKGQFCELATWTRCEVQFKAEHAQTAALHLAGGGDARELLLSTISFRELDNAETKRRSPLGWWLAWLGSGVLRRVEFPVRKAGAAIADMMAWVRSQVVPTLAVLCTFMGSTRWLENEIYDAAGRVPAWKWDSLPPAIDTLWARAGGAA